MTLIGELSFRREMLQVIPNNYERVSQGSGSAVPTYKPHPCLSHTLLSVWSQPFSVKTKSCTTQQELSRSGVSAPTCETFEIALSSYTYPLHAHTHVHTRTHTHTLTQTLLHNMDSQGGEFWLGCIQSCHPRDPREIWIWKDSVAPMWSACIAGQQGPLLRPGIQRPVRGERQREREREVGGFCIWKLNM